MIVGTLFISEVLAVTTPVQIEGVDPLCKESEEVGEESTENEIDLSNCECEKWHLLWPGDKAGDHQCPYDRLVLAGLLCKE